MSGMFVAWFYRTSGMFVPWFYRTSGMFVPWFYRTSGMFVPWFYRTSGMFVPWFYRTSGMFVPLFYRTSGMFVPWFYSIIFSNYNHYGYSSCFIKLAKHIQTMFFDVSGKSQGNNSYLACFFFFLADSSNSFSFSSHGDLLGVFSWSDFIQSLAFSLVPVCVTGGLVESTVSTDTWLSSSVFTFCNKCMGFIFIELYCTELFLSYQP